MVLYSENGWIATYEENSDGSVYANITDKFGKQYAYHQYFESLEALKVWQASK